MPLRELLARFGIEFDSTQLDKGAGAVEGMFTQLKKLGAALVGGAVVRGFTRFIDGIRETGDELDKTSTQLGLSTGELQSWRFAAELAGVDGNSFSQSLGLLQRNAFEASRGSAAMVDTFARLGVSVTDANGELKDGNTLLTDVAQGLSETENESERVALSLTILGRSGKKLLPMFTQGAEGIARAREEFEALGGGLSQETIDASVELTDEMARFDTALDSVRSTIALLFLPTINKVVQFFTKMAAGFDRMTEGTHVIEIAFVALGVAAGLLAIKMLIAFAAPLALFVLVAVAIGAVVLIVDDLITLFEGGPSVIGEFIDSLFGVGTAAQGIRDLTLAWEGFKLTVEDTIALLSGGFEGLEELRASRAPRVQTLEEASAAQARSSALRGMNSRSRAEIDAGMTPRQAWERTNQIRFNEGLTTRINEAGDEVPLSRAQRQAQREQGIQTRTAEEALFGPPQTPAAAGGTTAAAVTTPGRTPARLREPGGGGGSTTVNQENQTELTIVANGADAREVETRVRRLLAQLQGEQANQTLAALVPQSGGE